jgi:hypothetical protein
MGIEGWGIEGWGIEGWGIEGWGIEGWGLRDGGLGEIFVRTLNLGLNLFTHSGKLDQFIIKQYFLQYTKKT